MNIPELTIEVIEESRITTALDAELRGFLMRAFPDGVSSFARRRHWHGSTPAYTVIARQNGGLMAHTGVIVREIRAAGNPVRIYGIQNMGVLPKPAEPAPDCVCWRRRRARLPGAVSFSAYCFAFPNSHATTGEITGRFATSMSAWTTMARPTSQFRVRTYAWSGV